MSRQESIGWIVTNSNVRTQLCVAVEELSELQKEICKYVRDPIYEKHYDQIKEELADVLIMCSQLQYIFGITDKDLDTEIDFKLNRTMERLEHD